jgi:hypothetical protein
LWVLLQASAIKLHPACLLVLLPASAIKLPSSLFCTPALLYLNCDTKQLQTETQSYKFACS